MSLKEAYRLKVEAEMELAHAKLLELKAEAKNYTADTYIKYNKHLEELDNMHRIAKEKLLELQNAGEDTWEKFKEGVEGSWHAFSVAIKDTVEKFKTIKVEKDNK